MVAAARVVAVRCKSVVGGPRLSISTSSRWRDGPTQVWTCCTSIPPAGPVRRPLPLPRSPSQFQQQRRGRSGSRMPPPPLIQRALWMLVVPLRLPHPLPGCVPMPATPLLLHVLLPGHTRTPAPTPPLHVPQLGRAWMTPSMPPSGRRPPPSCPPCRQQHCHHRGRWCHTPPCPTPSSPALQGVTHTPIRHLLPLGSPPCRGRPHGSHSSSGTQPYCPCSPHSGPFLILRQLLPCHLSGHSNPAPPVTPVTAPPSPRRRRQ